MVDVGDKSITRREATARCRVFLPDVVRDALDGDEIVGKKGPVFATAIIAGLDKCDIEIRLEGDDAIVECTCRVEHKTGVEMEALTGASVAALTIYDMVKALSHDVTIRETRLVAKSGGKRDFQHD